MKGIQIDALFDVFEESPQNRRAPPLVRVEKMIEDIQSRLPGAPQFLLCLLPERKNSNLYASKNHQPISSEIERRNNSRIRFWCFQKERYQTI
ncbi:protein argonaute 4-like isoform X1 [Camellia sinensis]|uniref:protein argonaute 4-like isoform X1 n=1 Tax=Camellia sinensis TaxID=4442 RepID=UPI0010363052|nr:protein argonaute 4-like isoform X1 [Camellia sinensis]